QRRIEILAEMSRNDPAQSLFSANVRQVRFNAWDYADDHLWSGLMDHLFQALAADPASKPSTDDPAVIEADRAALMRQLGEREAEELRLRDELRAADSARQRGNLVGLPSPAYGVRIIA